MSKISVMNEDLANKIAAGEVVERTMNVVKELVENSIDALAKDIKIELTDSGVKEIIVTDDGIGMDKTDAVLCFSRHATSKLKTFDDLMNLDSLGFRGEALPSIASVSNTTLKTSNGVEGCEVVINGGEIESVKDSDLKQGTKIIVRDLFYNTPVRLKYLKNLYSELAMITDYVNKMALSFPEIRFRLINNDKELLNTDGSGNLLKVINSVYGLDVTRKMLKVSASDDDYAISGYISYPELTKSNRNAMTTFVNGRIIKNNELNRAIVDCYHTYIPADKFPIVVLNIETDPLIVDVNIHPTKMDIKFSKMNELKELINKMIKDNLENLNLIPELKAKVEEEKKVEEKLSSLVSYTEPEEEVEEEKTYVVQEEVAFDFDSEEEVKKEEFLSGEARIKKMYPVGVVHGTYIIAENEDGMFMIDQHAAAERINYEKYLYALGTHNNDRQDLLVPIKLEFTNSEFIVLKQHLDIVEKLNFEVEEFGLNTILVRSHPAWLPSSSLQEAIRKIFKIFINYEDFDSYKFTERIAITLACKMSIKANDHMTLENAEDLLERLRRTKNPFTCPHGRPTIITFSNYELEKMFKRAMN